MISRICTRVAITRGTHSGWQVILNDSCDDLLPTRTWYNTSAKMSLGWKRRLLLLSSLVLSVSNSLHFFSAVGQRKHDGSSPTSRASWIDRVNELIAYKEKHGDTLVPKRYADNPALGNWVNKQRQLYKKYCSKEEPCSLTDEKVKILDGIGFCWDASSEWNGDPNNEDLWWFRFENLKRHGSIDDKLPESLASFLRDQRREFRSYNARKSSTLDAAKVSALNALDPGWAKTFHERQWDLRFKELKDYCVKYGDCCVPIGYENRKLAHWVSNVRKKYNLKISGQPSTLTKEQIEQLNTLGFVWNFWDHEYAKRYDQFNN